MAVLLSLEASSTFVGTAGQRFLLKFSATDINIFNGSLIQVFRNFYIMYYHILRYLSLVKVIDFYIFIINF